MQHGCWSDVLELFGESALKVAKRASLQTKDEPRFGAELTHTHGHRIAQALGDSGSTLSHRLRQNEDGIEAAHFGKDRDRVWPGRRGIKQRAPRGSGTGEAYSTRN